MALGPLEIPKCFIAADAGRGTHMAMAAKRCGGKRRSRSPGGGVRTLVVSALGTLPVLAGVAAFWQGGRFAQEAGGGGPNTSTVKVSARPTPILSMAM